MSTTETQSTKVPPWDLPITTQVRILRQVAAEKHPKLSLGNIAFHHNLTLPELQTFLGRHGYPDPPALRAAADALEDSDEGTPPEPAPAPGTRRTIENPNPLGAALQPPRPATTSPSSVTSTVARPVGAPDEIRILINTAKGHPSKRIQAAANKLIDDIDRVKRLITEDQEKHAARRQAEAEKAAARAEVERLQAQLVEAKAKLGKKKTTSTGERSTRLTRGEFPCRNDGCDRIFDTGQGRSMHERMRCSHRTQADAS